jgi:hypothetical protein
MEVTHEYASKGVAGAGLGLGIAGTALALMGNGALGNLFGGCGGWNNCGAVAAQANAYNSTISALQADNARLRSEKYSDNKVQELYNYTVGQNEKLSNELCLTRQRLSVLEFQVAQFGSLTVTRIPNTALCPGVPAVEVVHPTTTAAAGA